MRPTLALTAQLPSGLRPSFQSSSIFRILFLWGSALPATKILYEKFSCVWLGFPPVRKFSPSTPTYGSDAASRRPSAECRPALARPPPLHHLHPLHPSIPSTPHPSIPPSLHPGREGSWSSIPGRLHVRRRVRAAAFRLKSPRKTEGKKEKNKKTQLRLGC